MKVSTSSEVNWIELLKCYRLSINYEQVNCNSYVEDMLYPYFGYIAEKQNMISSSWYEQFVVYLKKTDNEELVIDENEDQNTKILRLIFMECIFNAFNEAY